jgi:ATP-dependent DNA helicase DinG
VSKPYGKLFVRSLPPMTKTQDLAVVKRFFELERQASE